MTAKTRRNDLCPCGSGAKYKFCCISQQRRPRIVAVGEVARRAGAPEKIDFTNDLMNLTSGMDRALQNFCKDNNLFLFGSVINVRQILEFTDELKAGTFTRERLMNAYRERTTRKVAVGWVDDACTNFPSFAPRRQILLDAVMAHFHGTYTLSVPALFAQIEGILRDIGGLTLKDDLRPTIKRDWDSRTLFALTDSAAMFNAFVHKLYEGQPSGGHLNRNPILHGTDNGYATLENSLILLLTLFEIRTFLWFEKNTVPLV